MKKTLSLLLAALLMVGVLAGCTVSPSDDKSGSSDSSVSDSSSSSDEESSSSEDSSKDDTNKTDYLNWSIADWNAASESEKENAAIALTIYINDAIGQSGITEELLRPQIGTLVTQFDAQFASAPEAMSSFTLKQIADAGTSLLGDE